MQHGRAVALAVGTHIGQVKTLGQGEVALDSGALPAPLKGVGKLDVNFGAVKRALACADAIRQALGLQGSD